MSICNYGNAKIMLNGNWVLSLENNELTGVDKGAQRKGRAKIRTLKRM